MDFTPILKIDPLFNSSDQQLQSGTLADTSMFADIFTSAIENVKQTDATKNDLQYRLATGQLDNPAELTIAASQAAVSVELLVQLRNTAIQSYNSIVSMSF